MWLLGFELRTYGRAVSALNRWASSPVYTYFQATQKTVYCRKVLGSPSRLFSWSSTPVQFFLHPTLYWGVLVSLLLIKGIATQEGEGSFVPTTSGSSVSLREARISRQMLELKPLLHPVFITRHFRCWFLGMKVERVRARARKRKRRGEKWNIGAFSNLKAHP